ncbi:palmitoyl-acyl carrier protein thioesterase, chloroplastic-like [Primulina tabacum]|uniref:palmitoyl-acyl carrier protein thioesterase, chloroplastic-like n=1 Tax=Primulina tabacum TaxID=48773 RepID=UPI003F5AB7B1
MASMQNSTASLNVHANGLSEKNDDFESIFNSHRRVCFGCDHGSKVRKPLRLNANTRTNVETINGKKVNGSHVGGISYLEQTNSAECGDDQEPKNHEYLMGRFVENRFVFRQSFVIRSYEIGPDKTATMETLMNLLQETALNHVASSGVGGNGFGATREMSIRKLIWVVTRILVQVDKYNSWGDLVEIDTWVDAAGKNGMRRDWVIRDFNTKNIITRATSTWAMMNRETRRLSKIPDEVKNEVQPFYFNEASIPPQNNDSEKIQKLTHETAHIIRTGLAPRWSDMDANQHVNNVKYIGWILESVPIKILEDYNLTSMILEYRRECRQSNVLESLTSMKPRTCEGNGEIAKEICDLECTHLLRMEDDHAEIVRARSVWHLKNP